MSEEMLQYTIGLTFFTLTYGVQCTLVLTVNVSFRIVLERIRRECCRVNSNVISKAQAALRLVPLGV